MTRLIPEEVAALYVKYNIIPKKSAFFRDSNKEAMIGGTTNLSKVKYCCGIGICLYDTLITNDEKTYDWNDDGGALSVLKDIEESYIWNFQLGFDSDNQHTDSGVQDDMFLRQGFVDGVETRRLLNVKD